ncbi:hypothetical protein [Chthonobacter rhizosphaerae]|uniref:hypothetical protein n=1 Tax=Chthonobacter rhizosphaerae TaxID=2735553 RepID=UPI0015EF6AE7|nr:hypothetical protein [Chthonobacter rhizosphaerae]
MRHMSSVISLGALKRYLISKGWQFRQLRNGVELYSFGEYNDAIEIVLPPNYRSSNVQTRISGAIKTLSAVENCSEDNVVQRISTIGVDKFVTIFPNSAVMNASIRMRDANEFVKRAFRFLISSAHAELNNEPYYTTASSAAVQFAEKCRFGHTFSGSFGLVVEAPVGPQTLASASLALRAPPLERRVMTRLARGLQIVSEAVQHGEPEIIVNKYKEGLNANACEELMAIVDLPKGSKMGFQVLFSPEWGEPSVINAYETLFLSQSDSSRILKQAAVKLRSVNITTEDGIRGRVITLHSPIDPTQIDTPGQRSAVVEWITEEFGKRRVRIGLSPEDYLKAVEAHVSGKEISAFGKIEKKGHWRLEGSRDLRIISTQ